MCILTECVSFADKVQNEETEVQILAESVHSILHEALGIFRKQEPC